MNNKLLEAQNSINKIQKSSAIPICKWDEHETTKIMKRLLMQLKEAKKDICGSK